MKDRKNKVPQAEMKMPLEAVTAIMDGAVTELSRFIVIDDTKRPQDVPVGEWAAQQLIHGKTLRARHVSFGAKSGKYWDVTLEKIRNGVLEYLTAGMEFLLDGDTLDAEALEPRDSVFIISLGVFGAPPKIEGGGQ